MGLERVASPVVNLLEKLVDLIHPGAVQVSVTMRSLAAFGITYLSLTPRSKFRLLVCTVR